MNFTNKEIEKIGAMYYWGIVDISCPACGGIVDEVASRSMIPGAIFPVVNAEVLTFECQKCGRKGEHPC